MGFVLLHIALFNLFLAVFRHTELRCATAAAKRGAIGHALRAPWPVRPGVQNEVFVARLAPVHRTHNTQC